MTFNLSRVLKIYDRNHMTKKPSKCQESRKTLSEMAVLATKEPPQKINLIQLRSVKVRFVVSQVMNLSSLFVLNNLMSEKCLFLQCLKCR